MSDAAASPSSMGAVAVGHVARVERLGAAAATFVLTVTDGLDAGMTLTIDGSSPSRTLIGRSPVCSLRLSDPSVSRRHAALTAGKASLSLLDLGSDETTVNGVSVKEAQLHGGEVVRVGGTVLSVRREAPRFVPLARAGAFGRVVGHSPVMRKVFATLARAAAVSGRAILLEGETGTGKGLVAEEIHLASERKTGPFVSFSTRALPTSEIGDRLFGTIDGQPGAVAQALGGTLFLQDIGDLPRDVQARLLDVLEGDGGRDVQVIAGTRRDLDRDVVEGRFEDALVHHLAEGRVELPPLREREGDVGTLAHHFWQELAPGTELPSDFLPRVEHYPWPGNVRELKAAVLARRTLGELAPAYRSDEAREQGLDFLTSVIEEELPFPTARERIVKEFERRYVERVLARNGGSVVRAARASGVAHRYFQLVRARVR